MDELLAMLGQLGENQEVFKVLIKTQVEKYKPLVYAVGEELLGIYKDYADNKEIFVTIAKVKKNQFDAYVEIGFTPEQAMAFLLNDMTNMKNNVNKVVSNLGKVKSKKE